MFFKTQIRKCLFEAFQHEDAYVDSQLLNAMLKASIVSRNFILVKGI